MQFKKKNIHQLASNTHTVYFVLISSYLVYFNISSISYQQCFNYVFFLCNFCFSNSCLLLCNFSGRGSVMSVETSPDIRRPSLSLYHIQEEESTGGGERERKHISCCFLFVRFIVLFFVKKKD